MPTLYKVPIHTGGVADAVAKVYAACKEAKLTPENRLEERENRILARLPASDWHTSFPTFKASLVAQGLPGTWEEPALIAHTYGG